MAEPRKIPSPKQEFLKIKGAIGAHRNMVDSEAFDRAIEYAELEYVHRLCSLAPSDIAASTSEAAASACFYRIMGMHEFIRTLRSLSETPPIPKPTASTDNLNHNI